MIFKLFQPKDHIEIARDIYLQIVRQSRQPDFFKQGAVKDTIDGRFDLLVLNAFLVIQRLSLIEKRGKVLSQAIFDEMFKNLDSDLREMGFGDMSIGKKIRKMAEAFYGRSDNYQTSLEHKDPAVLKESLLRNLYRSEPVGADAVDYVYDYVLAQKGALAGADDEALCGGRIPFQTLKP